MKPFFLALALLTLSLTAGHAACGTSARPGAVSLTVDSSVHRDSFTKMVVAGSQFAELETNGRAPISSRMLLTLVAVVVVALRVMGLTHARAMADHERSSYSGKAQMFRSLHEERSGRREA